MLVCLQQKYIENIRKLEYSPIATEFVHDTHHALKSYTNAVNAIYLMVVLCLFTTATF